MNRHERRRQQAEWRHVYDRRSTREVSPGADEGHMPIAANGALPADLEADTGRTISSIEFSGLDGGDCVLRAAIGYKTLSVLGWQPMVTIGSVLFRAGPDPRRQLRAKQYR